MTISQQLRYEAWTLPWDSVNGFKRKIARLPVVEGSGSGKLTFNRVSGDSKVDLDTSTFDRVDDLISDTVGSLIRVYDGTNLIDEWICKRAERSHSESRTITISGPRLPSIFDSHILYAFDYPKLPSLFPDWEWGSEGKSNQLRNNEFDGTGVSEKQQYHVHGSSGTYAITVPTFGTTAGINPPETGGDAAAVKSALEAIAGINNVEVTGAGNTQNSPFVVEFLDPEGDIGQITIDETLLVNSGCDHPPCHSAVITTLRDGEFDIKPWTEIQDPLTGEQTTILHGAYNSISVVDDPDLGAPTQVVLVDLKQSRGGLQQIVNATPGAPYFGSFEVRSSSTTDQFFYVLVDKSEKFIAKVGPFTVAAANTWETFELGTVTIPDSLLDDEMVVRIVCDAGNATPADFYLKNIKLFVGQAAANPGEIVNALMDDATLDHAADTRGAVMTWVDYSSVGLTLDSGGVAWSSDISLSLPWGSSYGQAWDDLANLKFEWELVAKAGNSFAPGATTHELRWYNEGGRDDSPATAINVKQGMLEGSVVKRIPDYTNVLVEGTDGDYVEAEDATAEGNFGPLERFVPARNTIDSSTLSLLAQSVLDFEADNRTAVTVDLAGTLLHPHPLVAYRPGDTVAFQLPPGLPRETRRIQQIDYTNTTPTGYKVVGSRILEGEAAGWELVRRMWRAFRRRDQDTKPPAFNPGDNRGGMPTIFVAASNAKTESKRKADFTCVGVNDEQTIALALAILFAAGTAGQLVLSEGTFNIDPTDGLFIPTGAILVGLGRQTVISVTQPSGLGAGTPAPILEMSGGAYVGHMTLAANGLADVAGIDISTGPSDAPTVIDQVEIFAEDHYAVNASAGYPTIRDSRLECDQGDGLVVEADECRMTRCHVNAAVHAVTDTGFGHHAVHIVDNYLSGFDDAIYLQGTLDRSFIVGNEIEAGVDGIAIDDPTDVVIARNVVNLVGGHGINLLRAARCQVKDNLVHGNFGAGILLTDSSGNMIQGNRINEVGSQTDNTEDGIRVAGNSDRNMITGNKIVPRTDSIRTRYGINIAASTCDENIVVSNDLGVQASYGTGPLNDQGTGTITTYPSGPVGDNFVIEGKQQLSGSGANANSGTGDLTVTP